MLGQPDHQHGIGAQLRDVDSGGAHRAALDREDDLVQQLVVAKYALSIGRDDDAMEALDAALSIARHSLTQLLPTIEPGATSEPAVRGLAGGGYAGRLVRESAATMPSSDVTIADRRGIGRQMPALPRQP